VKSEPKTIPTDQSIEQFLKRIPDEQKRQDCLTVLALMKQVTHADPQMWGSSIVGFGSYHYKYASGREGDSPLIGFSPRKQNLTLYLRGDGFEQHTALLQKLGKHTTGGGCLYIKRLDDIDLPTLKKLLQQSIKQAAKAHT
jgi:hypothetical protein